MSMILDGTNGATFNDGSLQAAAASPYVLKNRIINGAMVIDQRNVGASVTPANGDYTLDRWTSILSIGSKFSIQQNAGSVTPPAGYNYYLGATSLSAYTVGATETFAVSQIIEGYNVSDLAWGTSDAKTVTLSFWVRSSLTGTFGGSIRNSAIDRSYPYSYTISSANTWEQKSITITGDTSGTWLKTNGNGLQLIFSLGSGSTRSGTAGAWAGANYTNATGATSVVGTNGATFYITGVQLEVGTSATPFERRLYNQELANCQRYFETSYDGQAVATSSAGNGTVWWAQATGLYNNQVITFKVRKRANPTTVIYNPNTGATNSIRNLDASTNLAAIVVGDTTDSITGGVNNVNVTQSAGLTFHFSADAEL